MALKDLVVDTKEIEEEALEAVVKPYFKYDSSGDILFVNREFWKLPGDRKVALVLTATLGRKFLGLPGAETSLTNAEIGKKLNMNESSLRVYLSQLRKNGSVVTEKGRHVITTQGIHNLIEEEK